jgi:hypothetical protein
MVVLLHSAILHDAPSHIVLGQMVIWSSRRCSFTSATPCPIIVADRRLPSGNASRLLCNNEVCHLNPLLSQSSKGRVIRRHLLDGLHNSLDMHDVEVRIQVPNQARVRSLNI